MRIILALIIITLIVCCTRSQVDDNFGKGQGYLNEKKYQEAIACFDKVINAAPDDEQALLLRSQANYGLKKYQRSIEDCERILRINNNKTTGDDLTAMWNLGVSYNSLRQFEKAKGYFKMALIHQPESTRLYENIGYSYLEEKKYDSALFQFRKMVDLDTKSAIGFYAIGKTYYQQEEFVEAIQAFSQAIEINPSYSMAYQNRGSAKLSIDDKEGCCADWRKCLELGMVEIKPFIKEYCE